MRTGDIRISFRLCGGLLLFSKKVMRHIRPLFRLFCPMYHSLDSFQVLCSYDTACALEIHPASHGGVHQHCFSSFCAFPSQTVSHASFLSRAGCIMEIAPIEGRRLPCSSFLCLSIARLRSARVSRCETTPTDDLRETSSILLLLPKFTGLQKSTSSAAF